MKKNPTRNPVPQLETSVTRNSTIEIKDSHFGNNSEVYSPAGRGMSVYDPSMVPGRFDRSGSLMYEPNINNARLRGGSVLGADYTGDLDMSMGAISPRLKGDTEKKLTNFDYFFVERDSWIDDKNCYVCQRSFKRVECHHCRSCGHGMCGDCGEGTINARRVCDICFKREKFKYTQIARNIRLQKLEEQVSYKKAELKRLQQDFDLAKKNNQKQISEGHSTDSNNQTYKERLEKNKERETKMFDRAQNTNNTLKTEIEAAADLTKKKEAKLTEIKMQTAALKLQLNQKLTIQKNKEKMLDTLKNEKSLHYTNESVSAVSDINGSYIVNPRNFSIVERDGVYNLSAQPYKI